MSNGQLAGSWSAWYDFWSSKTYAMARLRECGNRLHAPEKTRVFVQWKDEWRAEMNAAELAALVAQAAGLDQERTSLGDELREARALFAEETWRLAEENRLALERLTIELTGTAEQVHAMQAAIDKEQRVELLRRQSMRRILNRGLANGWSAWLELWQAKRYALDRLKQVGNQLRAPEKMNAFHGWLNELEQAREAARLAELLAHSSSLDTQLRRAKAELTNFKMVTAARDDEIAELKGKLRDALADRASFVHDKAAARDDLGDLSELKAKVETLGALLGEAERRVTEADEEGSKLRAEHEALLRQLLAEQRARFESELAEMHEAHAESNEEQRAALLDLAAKLEAKDKEVLEATLELARGKELTARLAHKHEEELAEAVVHFRRLQEQDRDLYTGEIASLRREIKELKDREERRKIVGKPIVRKRILDEGPYAKPIGAQVAQHLRDDLRTNATRVIDLFRLWDQDGDNRVSRDEFQIGMQKLGLECTAAALAKLFDEWNESRDEGGILLHDLQRVLRRSTLGRKSPEGEDSTSQPQLKAALKATAAISRDRILVIQEALGAGTRDFSPRATRDSAASLG